MEEKDIIAAKELFELRYGKTPEEYGYPVIDVYKKQRVYLYAESEEAAAAYKKGQNIIRWVLVWYWWPVIAAVVVSFIGILKFQAILHPVVLIPMIFIAVWFALFMFLWYKLRCVEKIHKGRVIWLDY